VTSTNEAEEQAQQTRWLEWQAASARANLRSAAQAKIVAGVALSLAVAFLLMQLFASPGVV
jgi:hypothetical protein